MRADEPRPTRGHQKRARTRQSLLASAAEVIAERGDGFSIVDVAARAGVSNGTFYNYFDDRDALVDALVAALVGDFTAVAPGLVATDDPVERFAAVSAMVLAWAARSPSLAHAVLRLEVFQRPDLDAALFGHLRADIAEGVAGGAFAGAADAATVDVVGGALLLAARRLAATGPDAAYQTSVVARLLQSLGVPARKARTTAERAVSRAA